MDEFDHELLKPMRLQQSVHQANKEQALYDDVKALHKALNSVLALYVVDHGYGDHCVETGLQALARHPELPVRASLAEKIEKLKVHDENH